MSSTTSTTEDVSDVQQSNVLLKRPGHAYGYLGQDAENFHHYIDEATNTIYVTQHSYEQFLPENAGIYWVHVRGDPAHVEHLDQYDDQDLDDWIDYVDTVRGWANRPTNYTGIVANVLGGGEA